MKLNNKEIDFITYSLNQTWNNAHLKLQDKNLGDTERNSLEEDKTKAKVLMNILSEDTELIPSTIDFITYSLSQSYTNAYTKLQTKDLGDIERKMLEKEKEITKELIQKLS